MPNNYQYSVLYFKICKQIALSKDISDRCSFVFCVHLSP